MVMLRLAPLERGFAPLGGRWDPLRMAGDSGLLPVLLIAAVLLCHGALGSAHQVWCDPCEQTGEPKAHHGSAAVTVEDEGGQEENGHAGGLAGIPYAAVLTALLGVALLGLLGITRGRLEASTSRPSGWHLFPTVPHHRPRGPTLPSLQVFRL